MVAKCDMKKIFFRKKMILKRKASSNKNYQIYLLYQIYRIYQKQKKGAPDETPSVKDWRRPTFPQTSAVSSAMKGLTSLFGMGRGEHLLYNHQNILSAFQGGDLLARDIQEPYGKSSGH